MGFHLGNHGCLDLENISTQMLGGPTRVEKEQEECEQLISRAQVGSFANDVNYSHMASNADLVRRKSSSALVIDAENPFSDGYLSADMESCWYVITWNR